MDCTIDEHGCRVCPYIPAVPEIPDTTIVKNVVGWNAGGNSQQQLNGDIRVRAIDVPLGTAGILLGFRGRDDHPQIPELIEHGLYFFSAAAGDFYRVVESGVAKTDAVARLSTDRFAIARGFGVVTYQKNDVVFYTSLVASSGAKRVTSCLYATGDVVE